MQETFERVTERHGGKTAPVNIFTGASIRLPAGTYLDLAGVSIDPSLQSSAASSRILSASRTRTPILARARLRARSCPGADW